MIDWMLTSPQKKKLRSWGDHMWLWLDEQRLGKFNNLLLNKKIQTALSVAGFGTVFLLFAPIRSLTLLRTLYFLGLLISSILVLRDVHPTVASWIVGDNKVGAFFTRSFIAFVIGALINILAAYVVMPNLTLILAYGFTIPGLRVPYDQSSPFLMVIDFFVYLAFSQILIEAALVIDTFLLSVIWISFTIVLMTLFRITQFFVLRIVDYPNGPVLALGGLLAGVAALAKAFL